MRRITIDDVAREAGVSRQTVSRAINDKADISDPTRERVLAVVQRLGYRPNRLAQSLITQRTFTIGVEVVDITNPVFAEMVRGIQDTAVAHGYNIFLTNSNDNPTLAIHSLATLVTHGVDGLIAMFPNAADEEVSAFASRYRPMVLVNRTVEHPNISTVRVDLYRGAVLAVEYLICQGHREIGMITNLPYLHSHKQRLTAFHDTLRTYGLDAPSGIVVHAAPTLTGGYEATRQLLTTCPQLTAIFAYNDLMAIGALRACRDMGRRVPHTCAVVGFDDIPLAAAVTPSLTTIRYDKYALGQQAMLRLLDMIKTPAHSFPVVELPLEVVHRESTELGTPVPLQPHDSVKNA